jgi:hypothetical protein
VDDSGSSAAFDPTAKLQSRTTARNSLNAAGGRYAAPVKLKPLLSAVAHAIPEFI